MLGYVAIVHIYIYKIILFSIKTRRVLQRQNCSRQNSSDSEQCLTLGSAINFICRLRAVWQHQYHSARSGTPRSVRQLKFSKIKSNCLTLRSITLRRVQLRAVWDNFGFSDILISQLCAVWYCAQSNSAQYHTARSHVFCQHLRENEFFSETILYCLSATQMGSIHEKNAKSLVTLPL